MKKKLIIAIMVIVVALVGVMVGCKSNKLTESELFDIASFKTSRPESINTVVEVKLGEEVIFKSKNADIEEQVEGFDFSAIIKEEAGDALAFDSSYFSESNLVNEKEESKYDAKISNTESFLGIKDASDATISIVVNSKDKVLKSNKINYNVKKGDLTFSVAIAVLA